MRLFGNVFGGGQAKTQDTLSPAEAFAAITIAAVAVDGYLCDEEVEGISSMLGRMHLFNLSSG